MNTYINLGDRIKLDKKNKKIIDIKTGEFYTEINEVKTFLQEIKKDKRFNKNMEKAIKDTWGLETELDLYQQGWKKHSNFIKIYRTERREYFRRIKLSIKANALLFQIEGYLEYKTNRIAKENGKRFTNKELQKISGLSSVPLKNALNELEEKLIIKRVNSSQAREIYINPYLMCAGNKISKKTKKLFKNYTPITPY